MVIQYFKYQSNQVSLCHDKKTASGWIEINGMELFVTSSVFIIYIILSVCTDSLNIIPWYDYVTNDKSHKVYTKECSSFCWVI